MGVHLAGHDTEQPHGSELLVEVIAGPETAARLGIPEGTVYQARHVTETSDRAVTPTVAERIRNLWGRA